VVHVYLRTVLVLRFAGELAVDGLGANAELAVAEAALLAGLLAFVDRASGGAGGIRAAAGE
jgi:hypothetical protein